MPLAAHALPARRLARPARVIARRRLCAVSVVHASLTVCLAFLVFFMQGCASKTAERRTRAASEASAAKAGNDAADVRVEASEAGAKGIVRVPVELTSGQQPYVRVRVNDSEPLWFMLDSGANAISLDARRARALNLKLEGRASGRGAGEEAYDIEFAKGVSLRIGDATLTDQTVSVVAYESLEPLAGRAVDGVLGYEIFKRFVVEIDYATYHVTLHDPQSYRYAGAGATLPLTVENRLPYVRARFTLRGRESIEGKFLVDTGAGLAAALLNAPFVERHRLLDFVPATITETGARGMGGKIKLLVGRVPALQLGELTIADPVVGFFQTRRGFGASANADGLLGGELLRRFKVVFDHPRARLILEPNAYATQSYEYSMSGLNLVAAGADFRTFEVESVLSASPAAEAGLRAGDALLTVNDAPAANFTLDQLRHMLKREGHEYALGIRRGASLRRVKLKTRRLI